MDNLKEAHRNARKDKTYYKEVRMVDKNTDYYLNEIQKMLIDGSYKVSEYTISILNDKGKERELMKLPYFPDRIIQWAIMLQIENVFMEVFVSGTCASLKYRGIHKASDLVTKYMEDEDGTKYCFKMDIRKFYPSINHTILKKLLRKKFKDNKLLELLDKIIDSTEGNKGIPIGSYLSQFLANYYLAYFDHYIKEDKGVKYYIRYMDDIIIFHNSKEELHNLKKEIEIYLRDVLDLEIKPNWQIFPTSVRGVDFVGYRHFYGYKLLRKKTCKRFKAKMMEIKRKIKRGREINFNDWCSANSYKGWLIWCNSYRLAKKYIVPIQRYLDMYYLKKIKKEAYLCSMQG